MWKIINCQETTVFVVMIRHLEIRSRTQVEFPVFFFFCTNQHERHVSMLSQFRSMDRRTGPRFPCSSLSDKGERFVVPSAQPRTERESWQCRANRSISVSKINQYLRCKMISIPRYSLNARNFLLHNVNKQGLSRSNRRYRSGFVEFEKKKRSQSVFWYPRVPLSRWRNSHC